MPGSRGKPQSPKGETGAGIRSDTETAPFHLAPGSKALRSCGRTFAEKRGHWAGFGFLTLWGAGLHAPSLALLRDREDEGHGSLTMPTGR